MKYNGNLYSRRISRKSKQQPTQQSQTLPQRREINGKDENYFTFELKMMWLDIKEEKLWKQSIAKILAYVCNISLCM
jgi:hypothetical protein